MTTSLSAVKRGVPSARPPGRTLPEMAIRSSIPKLLGDDLGERRLEIDGLDLGQEADLAEVHAQERHVDVGHRARRPQERAVPAQDHERVGARQLAQQGVGLARRRSP